MCVVAAVVVGGGAADRARLDVGDRHFRAGNRLAVCAGDLATDTGGCALRESGRGGECGDQPKRQLGKSETEWRSEEHTSELQSLMRISYAGFCLNKKTQDK